MNPRKILSILLIIGMILSLYLLYEHFSTTTSKLCTFGENFNCGIVNKSPYANLDGIFYLLTIDLNLNLPLINISDINVILDFLTANAFLGFLTLLLLFFLNKNKDRKVLWIKKEQNRKWTLGILIFSIIYGSIYLLAIQHFILHTYCLFCILLDLIIIASFIVALKIKN